MLLLKVDLLKRNPNYRKLFTAQMISYLGSMMTYMAVPYQIYELTKSSFWVGILGTMQLLPLLIFGLIGGVYADRFERKKILISAEVYLPIAALG
jgi:MFS family permease